MRRNLMLLSLICLSLSYFNPSLANSSLSASTDENNIDIKSLLETQNYYDDRFYSDDDDDDDDDDDGYYRSRYRTPARACCVAAPIGIYGGRKFYGRTRGYRSGFIFNQACTIALRKCERYYGFAPGGCQVINQYFY